MFQAILKSEQNEVTIQIPYELVGKLIQVSVSEIKETDQNKHDLKLSQLRGSLSEEEALAINKYINESKNW